MENNYEVKQDNLLNLRFDNKFDDEYFKLINGEDDYLFEDKIYISNYGEIYNKTQERLFDYENSSVNLKILNGPIKGFSRWNLTTNSFGISNADYETRRRLKKISYGYCIQSQKKIKLNKVKKSTQSVIIKNEDVVIKDSIKLNHTMNFEISNLELELNKYKFIYNEILNQKIKIEKKITDIENKIKSTKEFNDNKYKNTIIYMIRPKHNNFYMYVGHTIDKDRRLKEHIRGTENDNKKLYKTIRDTGGWEHWEMIEIDTYVCDSREEALKIEQLWCEKLRPNLNSVSPFA